MKLAAEHRPASTTSGSPQTGKYVRYVAAIGGAVVLTGGAMALAALRLEPQTFLSRPSEFKEFVNANLLTAVVLFCAAVFTAAACAIPVGAMITATGGFLFGTGPAAACAATCGTLGSLVLFCIVRKLVNAHSQWGAARLASIIREFRSDAASYLLFLRLTPVPSCLVTISAAVARTRPLTFAWTTALGILPATFAHALAGSAIATGALAQRRAYEACVVSRKASCLLSAPFSFLSDSTTMMMLAAVGLLALLPVILRKLRANGRAPHAPISTG